MAEHWCKEHQTVFFKKGQMKNYAHPIVDENGEQLVNEDGKKLWCNEPDAPESQKKPPKEKTGSNPPESSERQVSIEIQNSNTAIVNWLCASIAHPESPLAMKTHSPFFQAFQSYNSSRLGRWASMGEVELTKELDAPWESPEKLEPAAVTITAEEVIEDLKLILESKKMSNAQMVDALKIVGGTGNTIRQRVNSLSPEKLAEFAAKVKPLVPSKLVQEAKKLGATEVKDIPF